MPMQVTVDNKYQFNGGNGGSDCCRKEQLMNSGCSWGDKEQEIELLTMVDLKVAKTVEDMVCE